MDEDWMTILYILLAVAFIGVIIFGLIYMVNNEQDKRDSTCNNIGSKLDLDLYSATHGDCGWGVECSFQCKFIDSNGGIVVKNVD